jgi:hypothetical protein
MRFCDMFWCHSRLPLTERIHLLFKFYFRFEFFDIRVFESSWAIRLSAASVIVPYWVRSHYGAHANAVLAEIYWRWKQSQSGSCLWVPDWDRIPDLLTVVAHYGKIRKSKNLTRKRNLKSKRTALWGGRNLRSIEWYQTHMCKSRETIF